MSTQSTKIWASEDADFRALLEEYYKAMAAKEAYRRFFGIAIDPADPEFTYENYASQIKAGTANQGEARIDSKAQAKEAIDAANFSRNRAEFRKVGLMSGLDPEHFSKYEVRQAPDGYFESFTVEGSAADNWRRDNLAYNTGVKEPKVANNIPLLKIRENIDAARVGYSDVELLAKTADEQGREYQAFYNMPSLSFASPAMWAYLLKRSYQGDGYVASAYSDLAKAAAESASDLVSKQQAANASTELDRIWAASKAKMESLETQAAAPTEPPPKVFRTEDGFVVAYADTKADTTRAVVEQHIVQLMAVGTNRMDQLVEPLLIEMNIASADKFTFHVVRERDAILSFFKAAGKKDPDPLPDAPEFETLEDILEDKKVGAKYRKQVASARPNLIPRDMQCYLFENIRSLSAQRAPGGKFAPDYKHIRTVNTNGKPALLTTLIRNGFNGEEEARQLLDLCPDVYALLTPTIRLFRTDYDDEGNIKQVPASKAPNASMVDAVAELPIPNFLKKTDVSQILSGRRGRMAGSGVKSFSWSLDGTQPAEVDNNITATLDVFFQSADDFFNNMRQAGAVNAETGFPEPNFIDLIVNSPAIRKNTEGDNVKTPAKLLHREYKGAAFRMKAIVGWETPTETMLNNVRHVKNANSLVAALRRTKSTYYLQCVRHTLDFRQDGTVGLQIQYQASVAGILSAPNADILSPSSQSMLDSLEDITNTIDETTGASERTQDRREELLKERENLINQDRLIKYKRLLRGLFTGPRSKIYQLPVNIEDLLRVPYSELSAPQRAARAKRKLKELAEGDLLITTPQQLNLTLLEQTSKAIVQGGALDVPAEFEKAESERYKQIQNLQTQFKFVPFMFLGDLIDAAIEQTKTNNNGIPLNFNLFLSDTDMLDPLVALQIKDFKKVKGANLEDIGFLQKLRESDPLSFRSEAGVLFTLNIGDIPISVDAFQVWFKNHVIKKDLDKFYLLYFIKKVCADLITKAFVADCFGENLNLGQRFDAHPITLSREPRNQVTAGELGRLAVREVQDLDSKTHNAVVILPTDSRPSNLKGVESDDMSQGIHHHHIGAACGLIKSINFSREDQEYFRESNIQKEGALGPEQLRELYSVNLEMVGNNLYENGQYIYVSPTLMDADRQSLDYLGLHGYYMITSVQSKVTPEGFTTSIKALHQGVDFSDNPDLTPEFYDVQPEPGLPGQVDPNAHVRPGGVTLEEITKSTIEAAENKKAEDDPYAAKRKADFEELSKKNPMANIYGGGRR